MSQSVSDTSQPCPVRRNKFVLLIYDGEPNCNKALYLHAGNPEIDIVDISKYPASQWPTFLLPQNNGGIPTILNRETKQVIRGSQVLAYLYKQQQEQLKRLQQQSQPQSIYPSPAVTIAAANATSTATATAPVVPPPSQPVIPPQTPQQVPYVQSSVDQLSNQIHQLHVSNNNPDNNTSTIDDNKDEDENKDDHEDEGETVHQLNSPDMVSLVDNESCPVMISLAANEPGPDEPLFGGESTQEQEQEQEEKREQQPSNIVAVEDKEPEPEAVNQPVTTATTVPTAEKKDRRKRGRQVIEAAAVDISSLKLSRPKRKPFSAVSNNVTS